MQSIRKFSERLLYKCNAKSSKTVAVWSRNLLGVIERERAARAWMQTKEVKVRVFFQFETKSSCQNRVAASFVWIKRSRRREHITYHATRRRAATLPEMTLTIQPRFPAFPPSRFTFENKSVTLEMPLCIVSIPACAARLLPLHRTHTWKITFFPDALAKGRMAASC